MLGHKVREFKPLTAICLEDLVPKDNFYRQVERSIALSSVRELAARFYSHIGRTSVDPVVFFKLQMKIGENALFYELTEAGGPMETLTGGFCAATFG